MSELIRDKKFRAIQVFAPKHVETVTANTAWTPPAWALAFCVPAECSYTIGDDTLAGWLNVGDIRGIRQGYTYTFDVTMNIEVM